MTSTLQLVVVDMKYTFDCTESYKIQPILHNSIPTDRSAWIPPNPTFMYVFTEYKYSKICFRVYITQIVHMQRYT